LAQTTGFFRAYQTELKDIPRPELAKQVHVGIDDVCQTWITANGLPIDPEHNGLATTG
jgi:hypothetical protein